jgi:uncharacterized membrane protein YgdD (TMEM256/DUF423 family)
MPQTLCRVLIGFAALLLAAGTGLGAIASHALDTVLTADKLHSFETAVDYQLIHSVGLLAVAAYAEVRHSRWLAIAALLLAVGIPLFSGGVYVSSLGGPRWIAQLAPTGGISLILGWTVAAAAIVAGLLFDKKDGTDG